MINREALREQVEIDAEMTRHTLALLEDLLGQVAGREPTAHELAAMGTYLHNVYTGIENVLVRFLMFYGVDRPDTANRHEAVPRTFADPPAAGLPLLLPPALLDRLTEYRGFRHVFTKRHAMHLSWPKVRPLVRGAPAGSRRSMIA